MSAGAPHQSWICPDRLCALVQEVMLRRLKRDVMAELPPKRRQVVRLPRPKAADWPNQEVPEGECFPPCVALQPTDKHECPHRLSAVPFKFCSYGRASEVTAQQ
jgi:hypothetical protein